MRFANTDINLFNFFFLSISRKISTSNTQNVTVMVVDGELAFQQQENVREAIRFRPNEEKIAVSIGACIATNIFIPYGKNIHGL